MKLLTVALLVTTKREVTVIVAMKTTQKHEIKEKQNNLYMITTI